MSDIIINRQTIISFPDEVDTPDITEGIVENTLSVSEILFSGGVQFGKINNNRFEVDLQYDDDLTGRKIYVHQTDNNVDIPIFTGYVQSSKLDDHEIYRKVVAYDLLYTIGTRDVSSWWDSFWRVHETATLGVALRAMLAAFGINYVEKTLLNDSMPIKKSQEFPSLRFEAMLQFMCEANLCNPNINRSGVLEFVTVYDSTTHSIEDAYEWDNTDFEDYVTQPIDLVRIHVKGGRVGAVVGTGTNCLCIKNNPFFYGIETADLISIAQGMYNAVSELSYKPARIKMILSDFDIHLGDMVQSSKGSSLVCALDFDGPLLIEETINSTGDETSAEVEPYDSSEANAWEAQRAVEEIEGLGKINYYIYHNNRNITISDNDERIIITFEDLGIRTNEPVIFQAELHPDTDASLLEFFYYVNEVQVSSWFPKQVTFSDGKCIVALFYPFTFTAGATVSLKVTCRSIGGDTVIHAGDIIATVWGQSLMPHEQWNGVIRIDEDINRIELEELLPRDIQEVVSASVQHPIISSASDNLHRLVLEDHIIRNINDTVTFNRDFMANYTHDELKTGVTVGVSTGNTHDFYGTHMIHK